MGQWREWGKREVGVAIKGEQSIPVASVDCASVNILGVLGHCTTGLKKLILGRTR